MHFSKMYIFGATIESEGPGMVSSKFVQKPALRAGLIIMSPESKRILTKGEAKKFGGGAQGEEGGAQAEGRGELAACTNLQRGTFLQLT